METVDIIKALSVSYVLPDHSKIGIMLVDDVMIQTELVVDKESAVIVEHKVGKHNPDIFTPHLMTWEEAVALNPESYERYRARYHVHHTRRVRHESPFYPAK